MNYRAELKALEPKRWWHSFGIKRKYVDFNVSFSIDSPNTINLIGGKNSDVEIDGITIKEVTNPFVTNGNFMTDKDWNIGEKKNNYRKPSKY